MCLMIKGMDVPKDYKQRIATLDRQTDDGILRLFVSDFDSEAMKYSCRVYPIVEVPTPHGRLIDADRLEDRIKNMVGKYDTAIPLNVVYRLIADAHPIIEAEE